MSQASGDLSITTDGDSFFLQAIDTEGTQTFGRFETEEAAEAYAKAFADGMRYAFERAVAASGGEYHWMRP